MIVLNYQFEFIADLVLDRCDVSAVSPVDGVWDGELDVWCQVRGSVVSEGWRVGGTEATAVQLEELCVCLKNTEYYDTSTIRHK